MCLDLEAQFSLLLDRARLVIPTPLMLMYPNQLLSLATSLIHMWEW